VVEQLLADPIGPALVAVGSIGIALKARQQGTWLAELIGQQLRTGSDAKLAMALKAGDWRVRRLAYVAAIEQSRIGLPALLDAAMHDSDLPIRTRAAEAAVHVALAQDSFPELAPLLASRTALVRAEAVAALGKSGDPKPAVAAIADPSPLVRGTAQAVVRRSGANPADHYRALVLANPPPPNALGGLGETGDNSDIAVLTRSLQHPLAKGRAAAVRALRMLGAATPDRVAHLLEDTSAAVTRQVAKALVGHSKELDRAFLERLVQPTRPRHVRVAAYRLLRDREVWTRLTIDLQFVSDPETAISVRARADLDVWLRRDAATSYSRPAGAEAEEIGRLLDQSETSLSPRTIKELRFHLGLPRTNSA
jgi:hypothetical protein